MIGVVATYNMLHSKSDDDMPSTLEVFYDYRLIRT